MSGASVVFIVSWFAAGWQAAPATQPSAPIACEFRVFDGGAEISRQARVLVYPSGHKDKGTPIDAAGRVALAPGLYDVQAIRERDGQVAGIRWVEHLLVQRYPDEEGRHLEIINFKTQYGALELTTDDRAEYSATAFGAGDRTHPVATALRGAGYLLLVLPAGRYDVRVEAKDTKSSETWLPEIDIPAGRTRLRSIRPPDRGPQGDRQGGPAAPE